MESKLRVLLGFLVLGFAGWAWHQSYFWWLGPLLSLSLPVIVPLQRTKLRRYLAASTYYLFGIYPLVAGAGVFFGNSSGAHIEGVLLWLGASLTLSSVWIWSNKSFALFAALASSLIPPLALYAWMSPITAVGLVFPGAGLAGLILFVLAIILVNQYIVTHRSKERNMLCFIAFVALVCNISAQNSERKTNEITGVSTQYGKLGDGLMAAIDRNYEIINTAGEYKQARVLLFPETITNSGAGTYAQLSAAVPKNQTWLIGMNVKSGNLLSDDIVAISHNHPAQILFNTALPVPVSMWKPWGGRGAYTASWIERTKTISGERTAAVICYDQMLPFVWLQLIFEHPQVILAARNDWWARGSGIDAIQNSSSRAFARFLGSQLITAENQ